MSNLLEDSFGRHHDSLRISITDRCNFRCTYCMPAEGLRWLARSSILTYEEITRLTRIFVDLGVSKVRLTGGEPLVRSDVATLIRQLGTIDGLEDITLTTNGILLEDQAESLSKAGLRRINVSVDSLTRETFQEIVRRDALAGVLRGLEAATRWFPGPIKVNTVLLRGVNDHEIPAFAELARERGVVVRFIEFMPLDADGSWSAQSLVRGDEVLETIRESYDLDPDPDVPASSPSRDYLFRDGSPGKIGFINSVSAPFCIECNRLRLTADGKLRTCLFSQKETDLREPLRAEPHDANHIREVIRKATWDKEPGHRIGQVDFEPASRSMSQIGG